MISEERIRDLLAKNEFLYSELQKYKKENDVSQLKLEQYLNDFQKNVATLENSLQKSNASAQNLQRQNDIKQQQLDQLKNDFFEYQQKFEKIQEGTHNEMSEILQKYEENFRKLKTGRRLRLHSGCQKLSLFHRNLPNNMRLWVICCAVIF